MNFALRIIFDNDWFFFNGEDGFLLLEFTWDKRIFRQKKPQSENKRKPDINPQKGSIISEKKLMNQKEKTEKSGVSLLTRKTWKKKVKNSSKSNNFQFSIRILI